jgi:hypothetical protein
VRTLKLPLLRDEIEQASSADFARSALGVRCALASLSEDVLQNKSLRALHV